MQEEEDGEISPVAELPSLANIAELGYKQRNGSGPPIRSAPRTHNNDVASTTTMNGEVTKKR